jgi:hypothetical protein
MLRSVGLLWLFWDSDDVACQHLGPDPAVSRAAHDDDIDLCERPSRLHVAVYCHHRDGVPAGHHLQFHMHGHADIHAIVDHVSCVRALQQSHGGRQYGRSAREPMRIDLGVVEPVPVWLRSRHAIGHELMPCPTCPTRHIAKPCFGPSRGLCGRPEFADHVVVMTEAGGWTVAERTADDHLTARIISNVCGVRESTCACLDKPALCSRSGTPTLVTLSTCKRCPSIIGTS